MYFIYNLEQSLSDNKCAKPYIGRVISDSVVEFYAVVIFTEMADVVFFY